MQQSVQIDLGRIAQDLHLKRTHVETVVQLLDEENTVPFIARFRKEQTGNLDEHQIRSIYDQVRQQRQLVERRQTVLRTIEQQGALTPELKEAIEGAYTPKRLEDLYMPFKPRKQSLATIAREKGLGNLAEAIWNKDEAIANLPEILEGMLDPEKQLNSAEDILLGVQHILAEKIAEHAEVREAARKVMHRGKVVTMRANIGSQVVADSEPAAAEPATDPYPLLAETSAVGEESPDAASADSASEAPANDGTASGESAATSSSAEQSSVGESQMPARERDVEFRNYFDYSEPANRIPPHRVLAINRGEKLGILRVRLEVDRPSLEQAIKEQLPLENHPHRALLEKCVSDSIDRLLFRSIDREMRSELSEWASRHSVDVFAHNLRNLLLQPPIQNRRVLAIDPGFRTGCRVVVLDEIGNVRECATLQPHARKRKKKKTKPVTGRSQNSSGRSSPGSAVAEAPATEFAESLLESDATAIPEVEVASDAPVVENTAESQTEAEQTPPVLTADSAERSTTDDDAPMTELDNVSPDSEPTAEADSNSESIPNNLGPVSQEEITASDSGGNSMPEPSAVEQTQFHFPAWAGIVIPTPDDPAMLQPSTGRPERPNRREKAATKPKGPPQPVVTKRDKAKQTIADLCRKHSISVIAIGNGTACRETEELVSEAITQHINDVSYVIVNEAGASIYSTGRTGRDEFPEFDASDRSTISIGRRLQDPLSELVKIEPQHLGIGLYQHDINPKLLRETLSDVVESCVNYVGVDLNTASIPLLRYVSGLNMLRAKNIVEYRKANGPFKNREQLKEVPGIGPAVFTQAAGFLKITGGDNPFDATWIHPENYAIAEKVLEKLGYDSHVLENREEIERVREKLNEVDFEGLIKELEVGRTTLEDVFDNIARPGRDPREDLPTPIFKHGILRLEDLTEGMLLRGTVLNVVDFGVFVDVGLKDSGLVHISQLADKFVRSPHDLLAVGDVVTVWVLKIDQERRRVSLTMIEPGHDRPEQRRGKRPQRPRRPQGPRPGQHGDGTQQAMPQTATGENQSQTADRSRGESQDRRGPPRGGQGEHRPESGPRTGERPRTDQRGGGGGGRPQTGGGGPGQSYQRRPGGGRPAQYQDRRSAKSTRGDKADKVRKDPNALGGIGSKETPADENVIHTFGQLKALFESNKKKKEPDNKDDKKS